MNLILSIETSTKVCSVALHANGKLLSYKESFVPNSHSELINIFIAEVLAEANVEKSELSAICISSGPGSYTGLRIGTSTAKGLCFALDIPLIAINTLKGLAQKVVEGDFNLSENDIICPMIDARRMEVYCSLYKADGSVIVEPEAKILDENSFYETLLNQKMFFIGDGSEKFKALIDNKSAIFLDDVLPSATSFGVLAFQKFKNNDLEDLAYFEPFYLKEFHTIPSKKNFLLTK